LPLLLKIAAATLLLIVSATMPEPARLVSNESPANSPALGEFGPDTISTAFAPRSRAIMAL